MSTDLIARLREWDIPTAVKAADALTAQENALGFLRQISEQQAYEINQQAATIAEQAREIEALRADAERYRKWREDHTGYQMTDMLIGISDAVEPAEVDAAIDAAIEAGKAVTP